MLISRVGQGIAKGLALVSSGVLARPFPAYRTNCAVIKGAASRGASQHSSKRR